MDDKELGYLAGIIDGEGCIYVNRRKLGGKGRRKTPGYGVKVVVSITSYCLVEWLIEKAQLTSVYYFEPPGNRKPKWTCTWNNSKAEWLLRSVLPLLVIKKEQAKLGIELLEHMRTSRCHQGGGKGWTVPDELVVYRESIKQQIAALNYRGRLPA